LNSFAGRILLNLTSAIVARLQEVKLVLDEIGSGSLVILESVS